MLFNLAWSYMKNFDGLGCCSREREKSPAQRPLPRSSGLQDHFITQLDSQRNSLLESYRPQPNPSELLNSI
jgi:hypothetical protein